MKFTDEQAFAVGERSGPLFLSAGAGSGKTRVLVERFVRAVCDDDVPVERVLAITFTEKAAAELKARLRARFAELGEREHARAAEGAWIGTIHGFCARLLRAHALAAGLDPEYAVLEESDAARLAVAAFDRALGDFMRDASDVERLDLVASYTPDKLRTMVRTVHAQRRSQGYREPALPDPPAPPVAGSQRADLERALAAAQAELGAVPDAGAMVTRAIERLDACAAALALVPAGELGEPGDFDGAVVKPGKVKALQGAGLASYLDALDAWIALCSATRAANQYRHVKRLLEHYSVRYEEAKRERSALDFEDLELIARDLLRDRPEIRALWQERFLHVMVDEYQDTNALQDELLDLIAGDRLFAVGDDRQSIYGFRYADVEGFRGRRDVATEAGRAARLDTNFRSAPAVLEAINVAFTDVWGDDYTPLRPGLDEDGSVELLIVAKKGWDDLPEDSFGASMHGATTWRAAEARLLAARIESLVAGDDSLGYGDVAVLMRAATDMPLYERALTERGIPTYAAGSRGYFSQQQIGDLRAYLAALANPLDGVALYSLLASPLVGVSLDGLTQLRLQARAEQRDPWWWLERTFPVTRDPSPVTPFSDADRDRLAAFVPQFAAERRAAARLSLETVIDRAVTWTGYDRVVLGMPAGERRMANVRKLMRLAREFERVGGRDVRRFIDYVDEQELIAAREGEAPLETESLAAVRLMTIHAAKGLEFPVVAVADMGRAGRADDIPLRVSADGRVGLQLSSLAGRGPSALDLEALKREEEERGEAEERRVFYVAMTRAERHLLVSGATDVEKWPPATALGAPMDWAWRAFSRELPELLESEAEATVMAGTTSVRCVLCSPATLDAVLPAADRIPVPAADAAAAAREQLEPPSFPPVQPPVSLPLARLSYSALEQYARCGYRFYLERVARLRETQWREAPSDPAIGELVPAPGGDEVGPDAPPTDLFEFATVGGDDQLGLPLAAALSDEPRPRGTLTAIVRGSIVHELLERVDPRRPAVPPADAIEAELDRAGVEVLQEDVDDIAGLIDAWVGSAIADRVRAARRVRQELQFAFPLAVGGEAFLVNGVIDIHADEDGGALVVDYKSDRLEGADPVAYTDEHYSTQRIVYALAALRGEAERVEVIHAFLERIEEPVSVVFERSDMPALEEQLRSLAAGVIEGRFDVTDDPHRDLCRGCPGRAALCTWDESRTTAPKQLV